MFFDLFLFWTFFRIGLDFPAGPGSPAVPKSFGFNDLRKNFPYSLEIENANGNVESLTIVHAIQLIP